MKARFDFIINVNASGSASSPCVYLWKPSSWQGDPMVVMFELAVVRTEVGLIRRKKRLIASARARRGWETRRARAKAKP